MSSVTTKSAFQLAWPASLAAMITPLLGVIDTAVLARAGVPADIAGVALASAVISLLYWPLGFLRMSTAGLVAQRHGNEDEAGLRAVLGKSVVLGLVMGTLVLMLSVPITSLASVVMVDDAVSGDAVDAMGTYLSIRLLAAPFVIGMYAAVGWLSGQGRTGLMSLTVVSMTVVNAVLDILFVLTFDMGVAGIAIGTAIAELLGAIFITAAILYVLHKRGGIRMAWDRQRLTRNLSAFFALNANIFLRTLLLAASFAWFIRAGSQFGDLTLAANQILMQIVLTVGLMLDGPAIAAEALVGKALGKTSGRLNAFRDSVRATTKLTIYMAVGLFIFMAVGKGLVLTAVIPAESAPALRQEVEHYYIWAILAPIILAAPFYIDGVFIGATRGRELRNSMLGAVVIFAAGVYFLRPLFGNHGLWLAFSIYVSVRAGMLMLWWGRIERSARDDAAPLASI